MAFNFTKEIDERLNHFEAFPNEDDVPFLVAAVRYWKGQAMNQIMPELAQSQPLVAYGTFDPFEQLFVEAMREMIRTRHPEWTPEIIAKGAFAVAEASWGLLEARRKRLSAEQHAQHMKDVRNFLRGGGECHPAGGGDGEGAHGPVTPDDHGTAVGPGPNW